MLLEYLAGKKKLELYSITIHICVQSERVSESCNKHVKETNEWRVWWQNLKEKDVTAIGWENVNWSGVNEESDQCRYRVIA